MPGLLSNGQVVTKRFARARASAGGRGMASLDEVLTGPWPHGCRAVGTSWISLARLAGDSEISGKQNQVLPDRPLCQVDGLTGRR